MRLKEYNTFGTLSGIYFVLNIKIITSVQIKFYHIDKLSFLLATVFYIKG